MGPPQDSATGLGFSAEHGQHIRRQARRLTLFAAGTMSMSDDTSTQVSDAHPVSLTRNPGVAQVLVDGLLLDINYLVVGPQRDAANGGITCCTQ